jgi:hypothetical protein
VLDDLQPGVEVETAPHDDVVHAGSGQDALYLAKRGGRRKVAPGASDASITSSMTARVRPTSRMVMTKS